VKGRAYVKSKTSICGEILREIKREIQDVRGKIDHPQRSRRKIADMLYDQERAGIEDLERKHNKRIIIKDKRNFHIEQFELVGM